MNLVIEDAVEVKQPTKANPDVERKSLGRCTWHDSQARADGQQDGYCSRAIMCL